MHLAGLFHRTHESYLRSVRKFAPWLRNSPDQASENDLRRYLLFIKNDQQWEGNSLKVAYSGLKFFYSRTCPRDWPTLSQVRIPEQTKLPTVLTIPEVDQLIDAIRKPAMKCFFWTVGRVWFTYRPSGSQEYRVMKLTAEPFIHRFLQHVLPRGFQKVRHFGFAHPRHRIDREWLKMLVTVTLSWVYVLFVAAQSRPIPEPPACPHCGGPLEYVGLIRDYAWPLAPHDTS